MILNDFTVPKTKYSNEQLDGVLAELCGIVINGQKENPDFNGMVAAAVIDPHGKLVTGLNYLYGARRIHAERDAIDKYEQEYGDLPRGSIVVTTCSPCSCEFDDNREGPSCSELLNRKGVKLAYCGFKDPTQKNTYDKFVTIITENSKLHHLCHKFADTFLKDELHEETSKQILSYIKKVHPKGEFRLNQAVTDNPEWELTKVPLSSLHVESDDVSPYGQINWIDYDHVANITAQDIKAKPIVVDNNGWIIDGNHRAVAARDMGMTHIPAYVPVESDDDEETYDQHMARINQVKESKLLDKPELSISAIAKKHKVTTDYVKQQLAKGIKVELEHTTHRDVAREIALDHLAEKADYYVKLEKVDEVIHHTGIKTKNQDVSGLVNKGEPVPAGKEKRLLGNLVGKLGQYEVYKWDKGNDSAYSVFDPKTRISQMTISGHNKPHSFEIFGIYGGPQAPVKAADLYAWLVKNQGLTLVSDKHQSPGGQRVWQELEQRYGRSVNVYAFNMKTNQPINTGADDPESTHGHRGDIAQNVRLVAAPK